MPNPLSVNPESVMEGTIKALAKQVELLRRMKIMASQPGVLEGYTPDPELSEVVKQLPGYL